MESSQAPGVIQASLGIVGSDVVVVPLAQFLDGLLNVPRGEKRWGSNLAPGNLPFKGMERLIYQRLFTIHQNIVPTDQTISEGSNSAFLPVCPTQCLRMVLDAQ